MQYQINFRPLKIDDAKFINRLRMEDSMENLLGGVKRPVSYERDLKWVEGLIMNDDAKAIYFAITLINSDEIIGYTSISDIDFRNGTCFWSGIKLDKLVSGKGIGGEVALKILKYVFEELRMERCKGECLEDHEVILKLLKKVGYKIEGLMRSYVFKNGIYNNQWLLSVIKQDYLEIKQRYDL